MSQQLHPENKPRRTPPFGRQMINSLAAGSLIGIAIGVVLTLFANPSSAAPKQQIERAIDAHLG